MATKNNNIRARSRVGKYSVQKRIARGGFADVFRALDTIEGIPVALKVPHAHLIDDETLALFRKEVRITARLDHPNILPIKTAAFEQEQFVIVYPLGQESLEDRLERRAPLRTVVHWIEQMLEALAYAHERGIIHCDVKPENLILFEDDRLRLGDFGIAKVAQHTTLRADGTGTLGFVAPEQAMGRPSLRSDVFSAGLVIYRMLTGEVPEWPFEWPFPGHEKIRGKLHKDLLTFVRRATEVDARARFADACQMLEAFRRIRRRVLAKSTSQNTRKSPRRATKRDWKTIRRRQFMRQFGRALEATHNCERCSGPVSEAMRHCPWCREDRAVHRGDIRLPAHCPRCQRGVKSDWRFCAWCYGGLIGPLSDRTYTDRRYEARCSGPGCSRRELMPFMRYCPWCNAKVRRKWKTPEPKSVGAGGHTGRCGRCSWGIVRDYWDWCPWCGTGIRH